MRTLTDLINTFKQALAETGSPLANFQYGSNTWALMRSIASVIQAQEAQTETLTSRFYLNDATGLDLDLRAEDFNQFRLEATPSQGHVLVRSTSPEILPAGTLLTAANGVQVSLLSGITASSVELPVPVRSLTTSPLANLLPGTALTNAAYPTLTATVGRYRFTNGLAQEGLRGGVSVESDAQFRNRIQLSFRSNLTNLQSLIAEAVPSIGEFYVQDQSPAPGYVTLYVSSRQQTELDALRTALERVRPVGVAYRIEPLRYRPISIQVRVRSTLGAADVQRTLVRIVNNYLVNLAPGSTYLPSAFEQYLREFNTVYSVIYLVRPNEEIQLGPGEKFELDNNRVGIEKLP